MSFSIKDARLLFKSMVCVPQNGVSYALQWFILSVWRVLLDFKNDVSTKQFLLYKTHVGAEEVYR